MLPTPLVSDKVGIVRAAQEPAFAPKIGASAGKQGVRGISTRKVYPPRQLPAVIVRSYRTFSPLPAVASAKAGYAQAYTPTGSNFL